MDATATMPWAKQCQCRVGGWIRYVTFLLHLTGNELSREWMRRSRRLGSYILCRKTISPLSSRPGDRSTGLDLRAMLINDVAHYTHSWILAFPRFTENSASVCLDSSVGVSRPLHMSFEAYSRALSCISTIYLADHEVHASHTYIIIASCPPLRGNPS